MTDKQLDEWTEPLFIYSIERRKDDGKVNLKWMRAHLAFKELLLHYRRCPMADHSSCTRMDEQED